jgi:alkylation response protein AidB-like acyl-CoA dehydrogenase
MLLTANFRAGGPAGMPPDLRLLMVPIADIRITDDWDVIGLRGTGSKTVTVEDAFVPEHRIISFEDLGRGTGPGAADHGSAIYRAPLWSIFPFSIAATAPGMARGAVDTFVAEKSAAKVMETLPPGKRYSMQMRLAEASALTDSAELLLDRSLGETVALLEAGSAPTVQMRVRNRRDQAYAVTLAKRAGELLFGAEGSRGLYDGGHVQRAYRDLQAASVHVATNWESTATNYGQVTLGGQPIDPMY